MATELRLVESPCDCKGRGWLVVEGESALMIQRCDDCRILNEDQAVALPEAQAALRERQTMAMIDDVLVAAFEGGINYWARGTRVVGPFPKGAKWASHAVSRGATVEIHDLEDSTWYQVDRAKMEAGIAAAAKRAGLTVEAWFEHHDADSADSAVQLAIFGEIIFG